MSSDAVSKALFGSELDGNVLPGAFEQAKGGTLFINEILDLNLETQNKLYSALQERQFLRLGGSEYIELNLRVIVSTSGNPEQAVNDGAFREDLYYHLNVIPIQVPSLRQRRKDLPELIELFINNIAEKNQLNVPQFTDEAMKALIDHDWPGNARQLQNILQRLLILNINNEITVNGVSSALGGDINMQTNSSDMTEYFEGDMRDAKEQFEKAYLSHHLAIVGGNVSALAKKVGLERTHLYRKLKNLDINTRDIK